MKKNTGEFDRVLRVVIGLIIIALGILFESWWGLLGVIPLITGTTGFCFLYLPFGFSTCKTNIEKKE